MVLDPGFPFFEKLNFVKEQKALFVRTRVGLSPRIKGTVDAGQPEDGVVEGDVNDVSRFDAVLEQVADGLAEDGCLAGLARTTQEQHARDGIVTRPGTDLLNGLSL